MINFVKIFMDPCSIGPILTGKGFDDEDDNPFLILVCFSNFVQLPKKKSNSAQENK